MGRGFASGVVVVAEAFGAEAWAAAAVAVGEDVAALEAFGCFGLLCVVLFDDGVHGPSPRGTFWCKVFGRKELSPDFLFGTLRLKTKARLWPGPCFCFLSMFNSNELSRTKIHFWQIYFLSCRYMILRWL
jgi:hypothetical protein